MNHADTLAQQPAITKTEEEKDRQIEEVVALLAKQHPAWTMRHGEFMKLVDRPKAQRGGRH